MRDRIDLSATFVRSGRGEVNRPSVRPVSQLFSGRTILMAALCHGPHIMMRSTDRPTDRPRALFATSIARWSRQTDGRMDKGYDEQGLARLSVLQDALMGHCRFNICWSTRSPGRQGWPIYRAAGCKLLSGRPTPPFAETKVDQARCLQFVLKDQRLGILIKSCIRS